MARLVKSWNFQVITENCQLHYSMWHLVDGKHQHRHYGTAFSREGVEFIPAEMIEVAAIPKFTHPYQLPDIWVSKDDLLENFISIEPFPPGDNFRVFYIPIRITRPAHPKRSKLVRDPWIQLRHFNMPLWEWQKEAIAAMQKMYGRKFKAIEVAAEPPNVVHPQMIPPATLTDLVKSIIKKKEPLPDFIGHPGHMKLMVRQSAPLAKAHTELMLQMLIARKKRGLTTV